jgi:drug/metabolite transporter (DMT)-like permease
MRVDADPRPAGTTAHAPIGILLVMVGASVGLQLVNAAMVKLAASTPASHLLLIATLLAAVLGLSVVRFWLWNRIYGRYPISLAYPLSAIFFPGIVALAWVMGETVGLAQLAGATLVMVGVIRFVAPESSRPDEPHFPISD